MKPFKIFLFGFLTFAVLYAVSLYLREKKPAFWGYTISTPSFFYNSNKKKFIYKDISHIIKTVGILDSLCGEDTAKKEATDIRKNLPKLPLQKHRQSFLNSDSIRSLTRAIEYPKNNDTVLYPFFAGIRKLPSFNGKLIRVLHYGDSQIEGDRITSYLRNQMQTKFGGGGVGLVPIVAINPSSISFEYEISDNWNKFSPLLATLEDKSQRYGVLMNFARFTKHNTSNEAEAWIKLKHSNSNYPLAQRFEQCKLFFGYNNAPMLVELKQDDKIVDAEIVPLSRRLKEMHWELASFSNATINFKASATPEVYCLSLDNKTGIAVDNIPLRGSAGLEFTKTNLSFLKEFYKVLNVKLLILQFGVNIVPNVTSNYQYYEKSFYNQLMAIKSMELNLPIIVIGVSDVSRNGENGYESFPNIEKIRDAQKQAAFDAGCAFWDIFEAMGGRNSMPSWVNATPALAQKDFVHFTPVGAKIIGELFYRSLMQDYEKYLKEVNLSKDPKEK